MTEAIHQEVTFPAGPRRLYDALTDGEQFGSMTGAPAEIGLEAGAAFSCFGGMITGRQIELIPGERIVQAWRVGNWGEGIYSVVRFELKPEGSGSRLIFDHSGFPPEHRDHLASGWQAMYWDNLRKFLA